jgi:predicted ATPase/class 3 adenylate cyclase
VREDLPRGTVTFLFTDVEGSTQLLHELGAEGYAQALAEHRRVIRDACAAHHGVEVDMQGDAFFFAFPTAPGALAAALDAGEALASGPIRVRVGIHTGTPVVTEEGYVGADVHRAARIAAAGQGGQFLVSASTVALVGADSLVDLGEHRFKDLAAAERIYQLGDGDFPPLESLFRTNLPAPATPFLGRERELAEVVELLARDDVRILTLTGPGGTGKTRLALQAAAESAERYPDGIWWVPLASLRDPEAVTAQIAQAVGASVELAAHIADKRMLLLLDNFEHLLEAAPGIAELVGGVPNVEVLATSREVLQLQAEHAYAVPALSDDDGTTFFRTRVLAVTGDVLGGESVGELCRSLDNLPLALELAAARTRHLTPEQLLERLSQRLDLLKGGRDADPRQQTLRATIEWSHDQLVADERRLFARLSVFAGGCTLEAVEDVCEASLETLSSLVDKSLVRKSGERFWMLATIREFAAERLAEQKEGEAVRRRHAEYLLRIARTLGFTMESIEGGAVQRHDVALAEATNFRVALDWALCADPELGLRLATSLENFWISHSPHDALRWFDELVEHARDLPEDLWAFVPRFRGNVLIVTGERDRGIDAYRTSLERYRAIGDQHGITILEHRLGLNLCERGDSEDGRRLVEQSLARSRRKGFRLNEAMGAASLGTIDYEEGNVARGLQAISDARELVRSFGFAWSEANMLSSLASYSLELDRRDDAERYGREHLVVARRMADRRHVVQALSVLAVLALRRVEVERAGVLWGAVEAEEQRAPLGWRPRAGAWDEERERFAGLLFAEPSSEFEGARSRGRLLTLDDAMEYALGES